MAGDAASLRAQRDALKATLHLDWGGALGGLGSASGASPRHTPGEPRPHASLLATPASRHAGGRLTQPPCLATLSSYERGLEAAAGYSRSPVAAASPVLAGGRFTPRDPSPFRLQHGQQQPALQRATTAAPDLARVLGGSGSSLSGSGLSGSPAHALRKPSLLDRHVASLGAGTSGRPGVKAPGPDYLSPRAGAGADSLQDAMQRMQLSLSRTAAANSAAAAASHAGVTASPLRPAGGLPAGQRAQQADFRIAAAFPGSRLSVGHTAPGGSTVAQPPAPAAAAVSGEASQGSDGGEVALSMRLTPMFEAVSPSSSGGPRGPPSTFDWASPRHPAVAPSHQVRLQEPGQQAAQPTGWQEQSAASPSSAVLASRVNELEAQLQLERMRVQEAAAAKDDLQQQLGELRQRVQAQARAAEAAQLRVAQAEERRLETAQQAAALQQEVDRRKSAQSEDMESVARMQALADHHKQENEELRQRVAKLGKAWEQARRNREKEQTARLQRQLQSALAAASPSSADAQRQREREAEWERQLAEAQEAAAAAQAELASRCQLLSIEKLAHEQAAKAAAAQAAAAEQRLQAADAWAHQLHEELDAAEAASNAQSEELAAARQQADAAGATARRLRGQLEEQAARCAELEAALAGEQERSSSITARAETAEVAQQGLGSHVKAAHARLHQLQEQLAAAQCEARQLQDENSELREAHLSRQSALELELGSAQSQLEQVQQERDQLRQRLAKATADLNAQLQAAGQHRQQVAALQQSERELQAKLQQQEACAAQQAQQMLALQQQVEGLEERCTQLEGELVEAKQQALAAEASLAKAARGGALGATPLRDVVGGLRQELQEKDLELMQAHEHLAKERARGQELQQQVLDQAVELDELQRDASDMFGLRQQLASAQQAEAQLRKEVQQLRQQLGVAAAATSSRGEGSEDLSPRSSRSSGSAASPPCTAGRQGAAALQGRLDGLARELAAAKQEIARLAGDRDRLRDELDARDTELMELQGQLVLLRAQAADDSDNWLSPLPDPV